ncbi:Tryptophan--tRNA ligase [Candidatus Lokiarchaeum ossiferum]|uniref:Tryptophan--tRNA ligase n=1 Tax=Candidatus Lokiarchaeum ossiferum TaxID=2951803 RepID=A0ABY6HT80_9ARCH|nr:Tryptophan--tRNA ligase [Candidatus Lokiarchaeum sp. B-35]
MSKEENELPPSETPQEPAFNPWGDDLVSDEDYVRLCEEFGIKMIQEMEIPYSLYEKNRFLRRKIIYGHRDFQLILRAIQDQKPWAVMSGIKPSGHFHLGTMTTASEIVEFQKMGGFVYYAIADIESFADNGMTYDESYHNAIDNLADILTLGLDPDRAYIWRQSQEPIVKDMPFTAGRYVTNNMMKAIYGDRDFALYLAALVQVGDILMPQLKDERMPTVVPVGIDQDPHLRLVRDLTKHFKATEIDEKTKKKVEIPFFKPAATYHKLLPGLDDVNKKMSKSRPNSYFNMDDEPKAIEKKLRNAYTGGRNNREEQEKLGGVPEKCMIFKLLQIHFQPDDEKLQDRYLRCRGGMLCGICKKEAIKTIMDYIKDHNARKEKFIPIAKQILDKQ